MRREPGIAATAAKGPAVRFGMLLVAFVVGQWYWIDVLWRFVPPTDFPP